MDEADIRLFAGDQGGGKTNSAVAVVIDDCYDNLTGLFLPDGTRYKASPLKPSDLYIENEHKYIKATKVAYNPHRHFRVYSPDGIGSKIIVQSNNSAIDTSIRVFSNFTFYGIKYVPVDVGLIVENINNRLMSDGWIVLDESIMTEKRDTMTSVGKMMAWFGAQQRRRNLHMIIVSQYLDMVQSRFNKFAKTRVLCTYDKKTHMINLEVNRNSEVMRSTSYYAPEYWRFFKHNDIVEVPQYRINRTLEAVYS